MNTIVSNVPCQAEQPDSHVSGKEKNVVKTIRKVKRKKTEDDPDIVALEAAMLARLSDYVVTHYATPEALASDLRKMTIPSLKLICRVFKLRLMGKKQELIDRVCSNYEQRQSAMVLQAKFKRTLAGKWLRLHGEALFDRSVCVNDMDLLGADLVDIPLDNFFSFTDNGFSYGFDVMTFAKMVLEKQKSSYTNKIVLKNPYTRDMMTQSMLEDFKELLKFSKIMGRRLNSGDMDDDDNGDGGAAGHGGAVGLASTPVLPNTMTPPTPNQPLHPQPQPHTQGVTNADVLGGPEITEEEADTRICELFYIVDSYGYYTNSDWVTTMTFDRLRRFLRDMVDVFTYRANLTRHAMTRIVSPTGSLVANQVQFTEWLRNTTSVAPLKQKAADIMKRLITTGVEQGDRDLGTLYVLTALTLNSSDAAAAMPWLYDSAV